MMEWLINNWVVFVQGLGCGFILGFFIARVERKTS